MRSGWIPIPLRIAGSGIGILVIIGCISGGIAIMILTALSQPGSAFDEGCELQLRTSSITSIYLLIIFYVAPISTTGVMMVIFCLHTDCLRKKLKYLDFRPGGLAKLAEDQRLIRRKSNAGGAITIILFPIGTLLFAISFGHYFERTDNYKVSTLNPSPQVAFQLTQYFPHASVGTNTNACNVLTSYIPSVSSKCDFPCNPKISSQCQIHKNYWRVDWTIIFPQINLGYMRSCSLSVYQENLPPVKSWRIHSLIQTSFNSAKDACTVEEFTTSDLSSWDQVVFPNSFLCEDSFGKLSFTAVPRSQCETKTFYDPALVPTRSSYSIEDPLFIPTMDNVTALNISIMWLQPKTAVCVVDKTSRTALIMQCLSLFGGLLGVQQMLRLSLGKFEDYLETQKRRRREIASLLYSLSSQDVNFSFE